MNSQPSSKKMLSNVLNPHLELAGDLLGLVKSLDSGEPSHRFQVAAMIIFVSGVDKMLSLAFELLYIADVVTWKWLGPKGFLKPPDGYIECGPGLGAKLNKMSQLGVDISPLQWLIELRNEYIHSCSLYTGYSISIDDDSSQQVLEGSGPQLTYPLPPVAYFPKERMEYLSDQLIDIVGTFVDEQNWYVGWMALAAKLDRLPKNPEPHYSRLLAGNADVEIIQALNKSFVGEGAEFLK